VDESLGFYRSWFTLGVLGLGVSHEMRNLLMSIMGNMALIREEKDDETLVEECFRDIDAAIKRAIGFTGIFQEAAQNRAMRLVNVDLNHCIQKAMSQLDESAHAVEYIRFEPDKSLPPVRADPILVTLMLLELLSESCKVLARSPLTREDDRACPLLIQTILLRGPAAHGSLIKDQGVELIVKARGFQPWSHPHHDHPDGIAHPTIEMIKTMMKLFHGEAHVAGSHQFGENTSLYFQEGGERIE